MKLYYCRPASGLVLIPLCLFSLFGLLWISRGFSDSFLLAKDLKRLIHCPKVYGAASRFEEEVKWNRYFSTRNVKKRNGICEETTTKGGDSYIKWVTESITLFLKRKFCDKAKKHLHKIMWDSFRSIPAQCLVKYLHHSQGLPGGKTFLSSVSDRIHSHGTVF